MIVEVIDNGKPRRSSTAKVKVIVEDANDPPLFVQTTYEGIYNSKTASKSLLSSMVIKVY